MEITSSSIGDPERSGRNARNRGIWRVSSDWISHSVDAFEARLFKMALMGLDTQDEDTLLARLCKISSKCRSWAGSR